MARKLNYTNIPRDGLLGEWLLDGNALDTAGSNDGTATNVTWTSADRGYVNECGSFNGSSTIYAPTFAATAITINFWVNFNSLTGNPVVIQQDDVNGITDRRFSFQLASGNFNFHFWDGTNTYRYIQDTSPSALSWNMYTFTCAGSNAYLFKNGIQIGTLAISSGLKNTTNDPIWMGVQKYYNVTQNYFNGKLGLLKIYNRAIIQDEINNLYEEGLRRLGPSNAIKSGNFPLYSLHNLEVGKVLEISKAQSSGVYYDQSGNGYIGTAANVTDTALGLNNVMSFNGTSSSINFLNTIIQFGAKTIIISFKTSVTGAVKYVIGNCTVSGATNGTFAYISTDNKLNFLVVNGGILITISTTRVINDGKLHQYAFTRDGTTNANGVKLYIDGVLDNTANASVGNETSPSRNLSIGYNTGGTPYAFNGDIIQPQIYNRALTANEIQQLYYSNFPQN